jgi:hypothetical protein
MAAGGPRFKQHLLGRLRRSSSGGSTPVRGSDGAAAAAAAASASSNTSAAAAAAAPGVSSGLSSSVEAQQQQQQQDTGSSGRSGRSSEKPRRWQEREQVHAEQAAATSKSDAQEEGHAEEGQRAEVQVRRQLLCMHSTFASCIWQVHNRRVGTVCFSTCRMVAITAESSHIACAPLQLHLSCCG